EFWAWGSPPSRGRRTPLVPPQSRRLRRSAPLPRPRLRPRRRFHPASSPGNGVTTRGAATTPASLFPPGDSTSDQGSGEVGEGEGGSSHGRSGSHGGRGGPGGVGAMSGGSHEHRGHRSGAGPSASSKQGLVAAASRLLRTAPP